MKSGLFLNMVALYPVAELHYAQRSRFDEGSVAYRCDGELRYCHVNPFGRRAICQYCMARADDVILKIGLPVIRIASSNGDYMLSNTSIAAVENATMSTLASILRVSDRTELDKTWTQVYFNLLASSKEIFGFFEREFAGDLNTLYMFNGRFAWDGAARAAAMLSGRNYFVYDFKKTTSYYEFNNVSLHSTKENHKRALSFYLAQPTKAREVAKEFIESKIAGIPTYEKSYTELQQKNCLTIDLRPSIRVISIFPSSDDEYRFLGGEWGAPIIESQILEIWDLAARIDNTKFQIVVRMHPNMKGLSRKIIQSYQHVGKVFNNVFVLLPEDTTSTYTLIEKSYVVVCFCSTVATEANYMRKFVVNIGGAPYYKLSVSNYVDSGSKAADLINSKKLKLKPQRASIIWFYYLWRYSDSNPYIRTLEEQIDEGRAPFKFQIKTPHILRLLQSPFRAEIELKRPAAKNFSYFSRFLKSTIDIILNKFSIKS